MFGSRAKHALIYGQLSLAALNRSWQRWCSSWNHCFTEQDHHQKVFQGSCPGSRPGPINASYSSTCVIKSCIKAFMACMRVKVPKRWNEEETEVSREVGKWWCSDGLHCNTDKDQMGQQCTISQTSVSVDVLSWHYLSLLGFVSPRNSPSSATLTNRFFPLAPHSSPLLSLAMVIVLVKGLFHFALALVATLLLCTLVFAAETGGPSWCKLWCKRLLWKLQLRSNLRQWTC